MKKILAVHQGAELYGSDRSFAQCVQALSELTTEDNIHVLLGGNGPLVKRIEEQKVKVKIESLWIARKTSFAKLLFFGGPQLAWSLLKAYPNFLKYDIIYINTCVIINYILLAYIFPQKVVLHIREIPPDTRLGRLIRALIRKSGASLIFNSQATCDAFEPTPNARKKIVYNGFDGPTHAVGKPKRIKTTVLMVGRLNSWKGQDLLLEALTLIPATERCKIELRIVGSVFEGQDSTLNNLQQFVQLHNLIDNVSFIPFTEDISQHFTEAEIVVIPSRRPEPFGRVAIEGMSYKCCIVASNAGGLAEIIQHNQSGLLFALNDAKDLARKLRSILENKEKLHNLAEGGRTRYFQLFTEEAMKKSFIAAFSKFTDYE